MLQSQSCNDRGKWGGENGRIVELMCELWELYIKLEGRCVRETSRRRCEIAEIEAATRDGRDGSNSNSVGVDLTVLWFYGVRPWPVAPGLSELRRAGELALALVECGTGKSRSARLRLVPMHSLLPLSPHRVLWSRVSLTSPLPICLSFFLPAPSPPLSLTWSVSLTFCPPRSRKIPSHEHAALAPRLSTRSAFHLVPLLSLPRLVYVLHIRMTHIYHKERRFLLSFSLSPCSFFLSFSDSFLCLPRWHTREFAGLSLSFSPSTPLLSASQFSISLVHVCAYTFAHNPSFSFSKSLREHPYAFLRTEPFGPTSFCSSISFCFSSKLF